MPARISRIVPLLASLASLAALTACQGPDVGQKCTLSWAQPPAPPPPSAASLYAACGADYVEFYAANGCENLVCILSPEAAGTKYGYTEPGVGYCSKPCVSNRDCYQSQTELICESVVLDSAFIAQLDPATRERYLGEVQYSSYCHAAKVACTP